MIITVVGSGGKTTYIHSLASRYMELGKKVLITTTTHMYEERNTDTSNNAESIIDRLSNTGYCMAGKKCVESKISSLDYDVYEEVCAYADVVLVEGDGSKQLPIKYPNDTEPVIPDNTDEIHVVAGLNAIGHHFAEVSHRIELVKKCLGVSDEDVVEPHHIYKLLMRGYVNPLENKYSDKVIKICPMQADNLYKRAVGRCIEERIDPVILDGRWFEMQPTLVICGGGHVASKVLRLAKFLDFTVTVIDDREEFVSKEVLPEADKLICTDFAHLGDYLEDEANIYYVVVTRGHAADRLCVSTILKRQYAYLGMIGSHIKVDKTLELLRREGYTQEQIDSIHAPIGLPIRAVTPEEIAVSIIAEIIAVKNSKSNSSMTRELAAVNKKGTLCIITMKTGSSPRGVGSMMYVTEDGIIGSIGGGILEKKVIEYAREVVNIEEREYNLSNSESKNIGMICGGVNKILYIPIG